jgi:short-subunit dehydrogenase
MSNKLLSLIGGAVGGVLAWKLLAPEVMQRGPSPFLASAQGSVTALITGASAGIGEAYARRLAREGYNLVLAARREHRLAMLAEDLTQRHAVAAQVVVADLANPADIERLASVAADLSDAGKLDLLINNAGFGTTKPFAKVAAQETADMVNVHVTASVQLSRAALPGMLRRNRGGIINVSSIAAWFPMSGNVSYSASKRYLITFSEALHSELAGSGIHVQALCPGFTYSEFHDTAAFHEINFQRDSFPAFMWQTADQLVSASLNQLGTRDPVCVPGIHNRAMVLAQNVMPRSLISQLRGAFGGLLGERREPKGLADG